MPLTARQQAALAVVLKLVGAAEIPGAGQTIAQQAAAGAGAAAGVHAGGHQAPKKVASALGAAHYKLPIGALIIPHQHFVKGEPSHWVGHISQAKWVANQWHSKPGADDAAHKAVEAGTHRWVQAGGHEFAVHKSVEVHVPKDTDLHNEAAVKNAPKTFVKKDEDGKPAEHLHVGSDGQVSEPFATSPAGHAALAQHWKPLTEPETSHKSVAFNGKHAAWVPHDWKVYKSAKETDESKLKVKFAKDPQGGWHYVYNHGKIAEPPHGKADSWVENGTLVPDEPKAEDHAAEHGIIPAKDGAQPAKVDIGGVAVTKDELHDAIAKLQGSKSTQIKGLLKGHPLEAADYHKVYKAELEAHPHLKVPPGTKKAHVPEAKNAFIHHLAGKLAELSGSHGETAAAEAALDKAQAAAAHAQELAPHTVDLPPESPAAEPEPAPEPDWVDQLDGGVAQPAEPEAGVPVLVGGQQVGEAPAGAKLYIWHVQAQEKGQDAAKYALFPDGTWHYYDAHGKTANPDLKMGKDLADGKLIPAEEVQPLAPSELESAPEPAADVTVPSLAEPGKVITVGKAEVQEAIDALNASGSTAIKQILKAKGSPLAGVDYWAVIHAYEAAHPSIIKGKGTKQQHAPNAKTLFIAALTEKAAGLAKADQLSGHDDAAELYALAKDGTLKPNWSNSQAGSLAKAAALAVQYDLGYYVAMQGDHWGVPTTAEPSAPPYIKVTPQLKALGYDPGTGQPVDMTPDLAKAVKKWVTPKAEEPAAAEAPAPAPPPPPEPPPPPPKPAEVKPDWTAEEQAQVHAVVDGLALSQLWKVSELQKTEAVAPHIAYALTLSDTLHKTTYVMPKPDGTWEKVSHAQDGTFGAPLAEGFFEVTEQHHVIWHTTTGGKVFKTAAQVLQYLKDGTYPKVPEGAVPVEFPGGQVYHAPKGSTVWQVKGDSHAFYVKEPGGWKWVYLSGSKVTTLNLDNAASMDSQISTGTLLPVSDGAHALVDAQAQAAKAAAEAPPPPPEPAAEPSGPLNTGNDIPVTIKGAVVAHVPAGSVVYAYSSQNFTADAKYVLKPDKTWLTVKESGAEASDNPEALDKWLTGKNLKEVSADLQHGNIVPVVHGTKLVGEMPAGTKFYQLKNSAYGHKQKDLIAYAPDGTWYDVTSYSISKSYYGYDGQLAAGELVEKSPPTAGDVAHLVELAAFKKKIADAAVAESPAAQSLSAAIAYGMVHGTSGGYSSTFYVWKKTDGSLGYGTYLHTKTVEHWEISSDTLSGTHHLADGKTEPLTYAEVAAAVNQHMVPNAALLDGKVVKLGFYYNPKSSATYLEVMKPTKGYHKYHKSYKYGDAAKFVYVWHGKDGSTSEITPNAAAAKLQANTEHVTEAKEVAASPATVALANISYVTVPKEGHEAFHLWSEHGQSQSVVQLYDDGTGTFQEPGKGYVPLEAGQVTGLLLGGALLDEYGNTVVKPGTGLPVAFHLFNSKPMAAEDLKQLLKDMEEAPQFAPVFAKAMSHIWPAGMGTAAANEEAAAPLKAWISAKQATGAGGQKAAITGLIKELLKVPTAKLGAEKPTEPVFLKGLPPGITGPLDIFPMSDHGFPLPFKGTITPPGTSLASYTSPDLAEKIKAISEQFGGGKIVGTHVASLTKDQRIAWLEAWRKGDMKVIFNLDAFGGKVSPAHPGAPGNAHLGTHKITWSPWDQAQVPATETVEGSNWTPLGKGITIPKTEADNYLIKVGVQHAAYLSYKERRQLVLAHRNHDQEQVDSLSRDAYNRFKNGGKPLSEPPVWSDNLQPAKSYTTYLEDEVPAESWSKQAVKDFWADNHDAVAPFLGKALAETGWGQHYLETHGEQYMLDNYPAYFAKAVQAYQDDVAAKVLAEKLKPKYNLVPGEPGKATDQFGKHYLWHTGTAKELGRRIAVSRLARTWGFRTPLTSLAELEDGTHGALTPEVKPVGTLAHLPGGIHGLTDRELADIAREHVLDYALANPLSTPGDYLRLEDGSVVAADKHGAFDNLLWQGADRTAMNDWAKQPVSLIFDSIIDGTGISKEQADKAYTAAMRAAQRMAMLSDPRLEAALKDAKLTPAETEELLYRKAKLADHIQALWQDVYQQAGWELPPPPAQALTHGLHAGFSEPDFFPHVLAAKSFGVPAFFAGGDLVGGHVHTWTEIDHHGERLVRGEATIRGQALAKVVAWVNSHTGDAAAMAPKNEAEYHQKILTAAEVVTTHAKDGNYMGPISSKAISELYEAKSDLSHLLTAAEKAIDHGPASDHYKTAISMYGDPVAVADMAKFYLAQIQAVEDHKAAGQTFTPSDLPGWTPQEKAQLLAGGVKIAFKKANRQLGTDAGNLSADTWQLGKDDGELHLQAGKSTEYAGNVWEVTLPTGEVIEVNDEALTNTPKAQQGRLRFRATAADGSASMERMRAFLQQAGLPMEEATAADMENLYWRQLASILSDRVDRKEGAHAKVWDSLSQAMFGKPAKLTVGPGKPVEYIGQFPAKLAEKHLAPEEEAQIWRKAWANLTSEEHVQHFAENEGYLPRLGHHDIHAPEVLSGKPVWYRFDITPEQLAKKQFLTNGFHDPKIDAVLVARSGGLYSSEARLRALGTYKPGMSWGSDQSYGSSGQVFLRQSQESQSAKGAWVSPRVLARIETYAFNEDHFGNVEYRKNHAYFALDKAAAQTASGNETMAGDAVSLLDDIEVLKAYDAAQRNKIIADLKAAGIHEIRGLPVEDRVVTAGEVSTAVSKAKAALKKTLGDWFAHAEEFVHEAGGQVQAALANLKDAGKKLVSADHTAAASAAAVNQIFYQMAGIDPQSGNMAVRGKIKGQVAKRISKAMESTDAQVLGLYNAAGLYAPESWGGNPRDRAIAAVLGSWAVGSDSPVVIALQHRTKQLFGIGKESFMPKVSAAVEAKAAELESGYGAVLDDILTQMWQATQQDLAKGGVDHVTLYRVMKFSGEPPAWAKNIHPGKVIDAPASYPFSSWAMSPGEINKDIVWGHGKSVLVKATVPKELLLAYPRSGLGSYLQGEFVVLDSAGQWEVVEG